MGMPVYGRHDDNDAAAVSFLHPTMNSEDLAHLLDARGFAVRTGITTVPSLYSTD